MIRLTRANDFWSNMESGTGIVMRVITDEVIIDSTVTATRKCPCGTSNTINVCTREIGVALRRGYVSFPLLLLDRAYNELKFSTASDGSKPHLPEKNET